MPLPGITPVLKRHQLDILMEEVPAAVAEAISENAEW